MAKIGKKWRKKNQPNLGNDESKRDEMNKISTIEAYTHIINITVINSPFLGNNCQKYVCISF